MTKHYTKKGQEKLTDAELNKLLGEIGYFSQTFSVANLARKTNRPRQVIQYHVNQIKKEVAKNA